MGKIYKVVGCWMCPNINDELVWSDKVFCEMLYMQELNTEPKMSVLGFFDSLLSMITEEWFSSKITRFKGLSC